MGDKEFIWPTTAWAIRIVEAHESDLTAEERSILKMLRDARREFRIAEMPGLLDLDRTAEN